MSIQASRQASSYSWTYDDVGRLTREVLDHWDDAFDQTETFTYDLTGNRHQLDRDFGNDGVDQTVSYQYDENDRSTEEVLDDLVNNANDTTTTYGYDQTQNVSKSVATTSTSALRTAQLFAYNLQGRMREVVNEVWSAGALQTREKTAYEFDTKSFRVKLTSYDDTSGDENIANATWLETSSTEFLADHHNHTGYTQTIRETTTENTKTLVVDYTFGHDEIAQRTHGEKPNGCQSTKPWSSATTVTAASG